MRRVLATWSGSFSLSAWPVSLVTYYTQLVDFKTELKLIVSLIAYSTNWRLALDWDRSLDPTAIIWSLSIEEQFYLIWPILLIACLTLKTPTTIHCTRIDSSVIAAIVVNRLWLLDAGRSLTRLYYGSDTRADALLVGCLIALFRRARFRLARENGSTLRER